MDRIDTLTADTVGTVTLAAGNVDEVEVISDGAAEVFYRLGYTTGTVADPTVDDLDPDVFYLPATVCSRTHKRRGGQTATVVKLISAGTPKICVQPLR